MTVKCKYSPARSTFVWCHKKTVTVKFALKLHAWGHLVLRTPAAVTDSLTVASCQTSTAPQPHWRLHQYAL